MKRFNESRWDDRADEGGEAGVRSSGVRARGPTPPTGEGPCASLEEAYRRFGRRVRQQILGKLGGDEAAADDVGQQVWVKLARRIQRDLTVPDPILPALFGFVDDEVYNYARARKRRREDEAPDSSVPASKPDPEQLFGEAQGCEQLKRSVEAIFARMDADEVALIKLAHGDEESLKDFAASAGVNEGAVRVRLHRARKKFADLYRHVHGTRRKQ